MDVGGVDNLGHDLGGLSSSVGSGSGNGIISAVKRRTGVGGGPVDRRDAGRRQRCRGRSSGQTCGARNHDQRRGGTAQGGDTAKNDRSGRKKSGRGSKSSRGNGAVRINGGRDSLISLAGIIGCDGTWNGSTKNTPGEEEKSGISPSVSEQHVGGSMCFMIKEWDRCVWFFLVFLKDRTVNKTRK